MDWRRDIVLWGRLLGVSTIVLGVALAVWNATDLSEVSRRGSYPAFRGFIAESLDYLWYGALVLVVTEIVGAIGRDDLRLPRRVTWTVPEVTAAVAIALFIVGTVVTLWDIRELEDPGLSVSVRYFLENEINRYLWRAGMLIALAALAAYVTRRNDEALEEEQPLVVLTEP